MLSKILAIIVAAYFIGIQSIASSLPCKFIDTINITDGYKDSNQNFIYNGDLYPPGTYQEFDYIEDYKHEITKVDGHIRGCVCMIKPCIRLCCHGYDDNQTIPTCSDSDTFTIKNENDKDEEINIADNKYGVLIGRMCEQMYALDVDYDDDQWNFMANGSLLISNVIHNIDTYCFGISTELKAIAYTCITTETDHRYTVYPIGMLISIPFLIITFFIYACIPELRNIHGKCLMCYIFALTALYSSLITAQWVAPFDSTVCSMIGYLLYISVFFCFFWMNIMCYDMWQIVRSGIAPRSMKKELKTFRIYCAYGFGCPLLMTLVVMLIDHFEPFKSKYLPNIGHGKCWIQGNFSAEAIYVFIPITVIIISNLVMFIDTARKIWKVQIAAESEARRTKRMVRFRFFIYLRLFILMGIMWGTETISWMYQEKNKFFYATDFFNCIQGFIIFLICVCDARTRNLVSKRFCHSKDSNDDTQTYAADFSATETVKLNDIK